MLSNHILLKILGNMPMNTPNSMQRLQHITPIRIPTFLLNILLTSRLIHLQYLLLHLLLLLLLQQLLLHDWRQLLRQSIIQQWKLHVLHLHTNGFGHVRSIIFNNILIKPFSLAKIHLLTLTTQWLGHNTHIGTNRLWCHSLWITST
jgi:hypothetical protein